MIAGPLRWIAMRLISAAAFVMPAEKKQWARAMSAELGYCPDPRSELDFAAGCLSCAVSERCEALLRILSVEYNVGILAGTLFLLHAIIPESRSWPWMWPIAGGIGAAVMAANSGIVQTARWGGIKVGLKAGVSCASLFCVGALAFVTARAHLIGAPPVASRIGLIVYGTIGAVIAASTAAGATAAVMERRAS